jgi:hypothetical protein
MKGQNKKTLTLLRVAATFLIVLAIAIVSGCGGGGGSNNNNTPTGFTAEMLDAGPTYYVISPGDDDGTNQETIVISGTGPYVGTLTEESFDASDVSQGPETFLFNIVLNPDGTLTAAVSGESGETIITLTAETATYLHVNAVVDGDGTDTWEDDWFFTPPEGWL